MICGPLNVNGSHWCGIFAILKESTFSFIDLFGNKNDTVEKAFSVWKTFANSKGLKRDYNHKTSNLNCKNPTILTIVVFTLQFI